MNSRLYHRSVFARAFTLVELLVVIVIIAILASLAIPTVTLAIAKMHSLQVKSVMHELESAVANYRTEYNRFPMEFTEVGDEDRPSFQTDGSDDMITILTARTDSNQRPDLNPKQIPFAHLPLAKNGRFGVVDPRDNGQAEGAPLELRDLWGQPYHVLFDTNHDNRIKNPDTENGDMIIRHAPPFLSASVLIYSAGPDKIPNTRDDITSWR